MSKRKYEDVKGYWVYSIKIPSVNKYYIGVSKRKKCSQRWRKANYKDTTLEPYLDEFDSMIKTVLIDNLTKEQAYLYEGNIIQALNMNDICINTNRSGLIASDKNEYQKEYMKQYYENNTEYHEQCKQRVKQWYENNKEKAKQRSKQWKKDNREQYNEYMKQYYKRKKLEKQQQTSVH